MLVTVFISGLDIHPEQNLDSEFIPGVADKFIFFNELAPLPVGHYAIFSLLGMAG